MNLCTANLLKGANLMKNFKFKRVISFLLMLTMLLSAFNFPLNVFADSDTDSVQFDTSEEWQFMAEDSGLKLYLNKANTNFFVEDIKSGKRVYAFPNDVSNEKIASPLHIVEMQSTLVFTLWEPEKKTETRKNTKAASVNGNNFSIRTQENGFFIDYNLKSVGVSATLSVVLKDGRLNCCIPAGSIKETNPTKYQVLTVSILPYMISGFGGTEGQIILPDGCGEVLDFSKHRAWASVYQKPIYGRNLSMNLLVEEKMGYDIKTPYLALLYDKVGILSIPTCAAAIGYVNANPAGKLSEYANAYYSFQYRASDVAIIGDHTNKTSQSTLVIDENGYDGDINIRYDFIFTDAEINDLAKLYGEYLAPASESAFKSENSAVFDIYGFVNEKKNFLGFPYTSVSVLSSGEDIIKFTQDESYKNIAVNLKNFTKEQQKYYIDTNLKPISKVMTSAELNKLTSSDAAVYMNANPISFKRNSFKINSFWSAAKTLYGAPIRLPEFRESTHQINKYVQKSYLLKYNLLEGVSKKLVSSAKKLSLTGVSSDQLASVSYHDYNKGGTLVDTHNAQEKACALVSKSQALMLSNPADYAIKYCSMLLDIPSSSSNNDLCAGSFPFIQMALGDSIPYTVESVNLHRSPEKAYLEAMSNGSLLHYSLVLTDNQPLIGSDLNYLYSANYTVLEKQIKAQYAAWCEVRKTTDGSALCEYKHTEDGTVSVFANGAVIEINHGNSTYKISN